ncbi:TIGR03084 family metal-binding protein [Desulfatibacillum aliphaticivorans]|uniref:TIGR03084 family metal-binding protein n=1 Tax=Desulfatibacillum aliphaticivorans TaxID=218208 RepID=UPI00041B0D1E|nr:TIGR03084 family metal-binding protein [Desulfatibacillum aliphaticivorans]
MKDICKDLKAEYDALDAIVAGLDDKGLDQETPFFGWTIRDEISHIAFFDEAGRLSATDKEGFQKQMQWLLEGIKDFDDVHKKVHALGRGKTAQELMAWWREERTAELKALEALDPKDRLPWYGPDMSALSFATARLMETWAHGQDVVDALGAQREATDRLSHVAHIGFITFKWAYVNRQAPVPEKTVRVELKSPSGADWNFGDENTDQLVKGDALDFCLVVTQRRNVGDTGLEVVGDVAKEWMEIAQAFAGPPETPPALGQRK